MADLTIIYATAQKIPPMFAGRVRARLEMSASDYPIVELRTTPEESSITNYYRQLLATAQEIETPYLAFAEDDTLYPYEHFNQRPSDTETFAYNDNRWNLYTWSNPPFFSLRQRKILATLIAPRELFIKAMQERLGKYTDEGRLSEPGRVEGEKVENFTTYNPVVVFTHPEAFGYMNGSKRATKIRALELPFHGRAVDVVKLYKENQNEKVRPLDSYTQPS